MLSNPFHVYIMFFQCVFGKKNPDNGIYVHAFTGIKNIIFPSLLISFRFLRHFNLFSKSKLFPVYWDNYYFMINHNQSSHLKCLQSTNVNDLHTTPLSNWSNSVVLFRLNIMSNRAELQKRSMWAVRQTLRLDKASYAELRIGIIASDVWRSVRHTMISTFLNLENTVRKWFHFLDSSIIKKI